MGKPVHYATPSMIQMYEAGASIRALMATTGQTYCEVRRGLINRGVQLRPRGHVRTAA